MMNKDEHEEAKKKDPTIKKYARRWLEYGKAKEGYWTSDKCMDQMKDAVKIAEAKFPKEDGWRIVWIFDHRSCHTAMPDDSLDVTQMNVNPGGRRVMRWLVGWQAPKDELCSRGASRIMPGVRRERGQNPWKECR